MTIDILGTAYDVAYIDKPPQGLDDCAGYIDPTAREIRIVRQVPELGAVKDLRNLERQTLRHEIIHAYLHECGLAHNSMSVDAWAVNEEMVDWFAAMASRMIKTFKEAQAL